MNVESNSDHEPATTPRQETAPALLYTAPRQAEIREVPLGEGEALLAMEVSALSRGTERLVFEGRVPQSEMHRHPSKSRRSSAAAVVRLMPCAPQ